MRMRGSRNSVVDLERRFEILNRVFRGGGFPSLSVL